MRDQKGVTLIILFMTVILLLLLAGLIVTTGVNTFNDSKVVKFDSYMQVIQKKVDLIIADGEEITNYGQAMPENKKEKLQEIIENTNEITTDDVDDENLRYFTVTDINDDFGLSGINDEIVVNFMNREIISLNGIEKNNNIYYTLKSLH